MISNPPDVPYVISVTSPPACVDLKPNVYEVEHQGTVGSCTAHAVVEALEALRKEDYSRLYLYWQTRNGVQNAPRQIGTNVRDTLRAAAHFGVPLEADWPYLEANVDEQPDDAVVLKAQERKLKRYERVPCVVMPAVLSADALHAYFKSALAEGLPIVATMYIGTALYDLKGPWQTHSYTSVSAGGNPYLGMHAVLIIGYDDACQRYLIQNSWGPDYADGGFFGMPYSVAENDIADAWVIREFYDIAVPVPRPAQALEKITLGLPYAQYKTNSMFYFDRPMVRIDTYDGTMVGMFALLADSVEIQYADLTALVRKSPSGFSVQRKTP
jgi:hypothetical protein